MENITLCDQLDAILNKIPAYSEAGIAEIGIQHELYNTLLNKNLEGNAHVKKHIPVCYDIGLNIDRAKNEKVPKKQQYWYDRAKDDFKADIKALKEELSCSAAPIVDDLGANWS